MPKDVSKKNIYQKYENNFQVPSKTIMFKNFWEIFVLGVYGWTHFSY